MSYLKEIRGKGEGEGGTRRKRVHKGEKGGRKGEGGTRRKRVHKGERREEGKGKGDKNKYVTDRKIEGNLQQRIIIRKWEERKGKEKVGHEIGKTL